MTRLLITAGGVLLFALAPLAQEDNQGEPLFDGKTLVGWKGNLKVFRVQDGAIVAGRAEGRNPRNEFLCTTNQYGDFELRLKVKVIPGTTNGGIQFRSRRIPDHHEVKGYQADVGAGWWGKLYDESRRRRVLAGPDAQKLAEVLKPEDWNEYVVHCEGDHIQMWINGFQTVDYTEPDKGLPKEGIIGVQIHGGPPGEAWYKDIMIKEL